MQTHIIQAGTVVNTIVATVEEAQAAFPAATCIEATTGGIGWTWDGTTLSAPPAPPPAIPQAVTMRQARLALLGAGLLDDVEAAINAMSEPAKTAARIEWDYSSELQRAHPLVTQLGGALGLDAAALDALFVTAADL